MKKENHQLSYLQVKQNRVYSSTYTFCGLQGSNHYGLTEASLDKTSFLLDSRDPPPLFLLVAGICKIYDVNLFFFLKQSKLLSKYNSNSYIKHTCRNTYIKWALVFCNCTHFPSLFILPDDHFILSLSTIKISRFFCENTDIYKITYRHTRKLRFLENQNYIVFYNLLLSLMYFYAPF